jgi:ABC-2 type transport system permease protein
VSQTITIARRELLVYLLTPSGYLITALFLFLTSMVFFVVAPLGRMGFSQGQPASMQLFFQVGLWTFFIIAPAISMRTVSEELRLGTFETLMTAPVTDMQIVLGKFAGSFGFLVLMLAPTLLYVVALECYGRPDYGEVFSGYLGLLLAGATLLASGILASTLTSSQVLAYLATMFFWLILLLIALGLPAIAVTAETVAAREGGTFINTMLGWVESAASFFSAGNPVNRAQDFVVGLLDSFNIVYFLSLTIVFLLAAVKLLGRWRWP